MTPGSTYEPIEVTEQVDVWASCPRCKKSLQFYNKQASESVGVPHGDASCECGHWKLIADIKMAAVK